MTWNPIARLHRLPIFGLIRTSAKIYEPCLVNKLSRKLELFWPASTMVKEIVDLSGADSVK